MSKLVLRKALALLVNGAIFLLIYYVGGGVLMTLANFFKSALLRLFILIGIPLAILLRRTFCRRVDNADLRRAYLAALDRERSFLKNEWQYTLHFPEFRVEAALLLIPAVILPIPLLAATEGMLLARVLAALSMMLLGAALAFFATFALWALVHRTWYREWQELGCPGREEASDEKR